MKDLIYFIPVFLLVGLGFAIPHVVKVGDVVCTSQFGPCSNYISEKTGKIKGMSITDAKSQLGKVFQKDAKVVNFTAKFRLPNKLMVWVVERKPVAALQFGNSNKYTLVDKDGKVLGLQTEVSLPVVLIESKTDDRSVSFAANLMDSLFLVYQTKLGHLRADGSLQVDNINGKTVIFPLDGDRDTLIGSLKVILSGLITEPSASRIRQIDLRFKNPVIK